MRPFGEATGWQCPGGYDVVESRSKDFAALCGDLGCDMSAGIDLESFASVVDDTSASGLFCTDEEFGTALAARRAAAATTTRLESVAAGVVDITGFPGPARASPAVLEVTVDSDSDPTDEQLAADLALAITSPDSTGAHSASVPARPEPDAGTAPPSAASLSMIPLSWTRGLLATNAGPTDPRMSPSMAHGPSSGTCGTPMTCPSARCSPLRSWIQRPCDGFKGLLLLLLLFNY